MQKPVTILLRNEFEMGFFSFFLSWGDGGGVGGLLLFLRVAIKRVGFVKVKKRGDGSMKSFDIFISNALPACIFSRDVLAS